MQARPFIAIALVALVGAAAACQTNVPAAVDKKPLTKKTATPVPTPRPTATPTPTPAPAVADSPATDDSVDSPSPSPSKTPGPFDEPGNPGSPPPFKFPYSTPNQQIDYTLKVKAGAFPLDGAVTIVVRAVTDKDATVDTTFALSASLLGGSNQPQASRTVVSRSVQNPFSLVSLLNGKAAGEKGATAAAAADDIAKNTTDTIVKWATEPLTTDGGQFNTDKYLINEVTGSDTTTIVLWVDSQSGTMVKEQIDSPKPPNLGASLPIPAGFPLGKTSITLTLKDIGKASPDPNATGGASPDSHGTGAASADPHGTQAASPDGNGSGASSPSPAASGAASPAVGLM